MSIMISSGSLYNFHMLFLNSIAISHALIFFIVRIKCTCFVALQTVTNIKSKPCACGNLTIKSTDIDFQGLLGTSNGLSFPVGNSG